MEYVSITLHILRSLKVNIRYDHLYSSLQPQVFKATSLINSLDRLQNNSPGFMKDLQSSSSDVDYLLFCSLSTERTENGITVLRAGLWGDQSLPDTLLLCAFLCNSVMQKNVVVINQKLSRRCCIIDQI